MPGERHILVNGNHTLAAVAESGVTIPLTFIHQNVATIEDAAQAYACFDIQRSRTWMQAAQAQGLTDEIPMLSRALPAMTFIMNDFRDNNDAMSEKATLQSRHARFDAVKEYRGALTALRGLMNGNPIENQRVAQRAAVMAIAMVTMKAQPSTAEEFWGGMVKDDGLRVGDPRRTLLRYLLAHTVRVAHRDILLSSALAWNAHFEGRSLEACKPGQLKQLRILGTKWAVPVEIRQKAVEKKESRATPPQASAV
jgi:hypothetical protein